MPAKKPVLGQHWLNHSPSLQAMVAAAQLRAEETVVEIGTGLGSLTDELIKTGASVISLEYDARLHQKNLEKYNLREIRNLRLLQADVRQFDWRVLEGPYKICANIPYYLTANLLRRLVDTDHKPSLAVLLLPKDVSLKLAQTRKRSLLSVLVQSHYKIDLRQEVTKELFQPPPPITSQITVLRLEPTLGDCQPEDWRKLVKLFKLCFANQRKQLNVNLRNALNLSRDHADVLLTRAGIESRQRAEELSDEQWRQLLLSVKSLL